MWFGVALFNPLLSFLSLGVLPLYGTDSVLAYKNTVLAKMGLAVGGPMLETWISIDAFIVLSGAVLTAYVGITGLVRRLASDRVLPGFLLHTNEVRGTNHFIIFGYFIIASSLVLILEGDVETLSGVYTYAFLGLMILFTCGCMLLKFKRAELPRNIVAPWWTCLLGIVMVALGFLGNLLGDPMILTYFAVYFLVVLVVVSIMFERIFLLRIALYFLQRLCPSRSSDDAERPLSSTGARGGRTIAKVCVHHSKLPAFVICCRLLWILINLRSYFSAKNWIFRRLTKQFYTYERMNKRLPYESSMCTVGMKVRWRKILPRSWLCLIESTPNSKSTLYRSMVHLHPS